MGSITPSGDQRVVFRDSKAMLVQGISGLVLLALSGAWIAAGIWISAAITAVAAMYELGSAFGHVNIEGDELVLYAFFENRRLRLSDVAGVEPNFEGYFLRTPHLVLHSEQWISLTPFRCPSLLVTRSRAAERLAAQLGLPVSDPPPPAFRLGWFACAAVIAVGFLFGIPLLISGVAEIVGGGILSGLAILAVGAVLCGCAAAAIRAQRARRAAELASTPRSA